MGLQNCWLVQSKNTLLTQFAGQTMVNPTDQLCNLPACCQSNMQHPDRKEVTGVLSAIFRQAVLRGGSFLFCFVLQVVQLHLLCSFTFSTAAAVSQQDLIKPARWNGLDGTRRLSNHKTLEHVLPAGFKNTTQNFMKSTQLSASSAGKVDHMHEIERSAGTTARNCRAAPTEMRQHNTVSWSVCILVTWTESRRL